MAEITVHSPTHAASTNTLIFFITGNPGLIAYYDIFFSHLRSLLSPNASSKTSFIVYGKSLAGFEDDGSSLTRDVPFGLEEQINYVYSVLDSQRVSASSGEKRFDNVILMGHSVGSFILLELLKRISTSSDPQIKVQAGILLFPTVMDLAKSPTGLRVAPLIRIPQFEWGVQMIAKAILGWLPKAWVRKVVGVVTGMPKEAAEVTGTFLQSRMGVWQALYLARDELKMISEDRWNEDIWGVEHPDPASTKKVPKLYFYFAETDHWVANTTRDALIKARGQGEGLSSSSKPKMMIDESKVPHAFCLRDSETVAEKVKVWIDEITSL